MTEIEIGKLIALAPLLVALIVAVRVGLKALKADPMTDDDKDSRNEAFKAGLYIFAAATLIWKFTPSFGTGLTILWTILTSIFAVMVILTVIELSSKYDNLHDRLWTAGRKTPLYSKSDEGVQYIRWARRIMLAVLVVVAIFCGIFGALTTTSSADQAAKAGPAPTTQAEASKTPSSTTAPTTTAPTSAAAPAAPTRSRTSAVVSTPRRSARRRTSTSRSPTSCSSATTATGRRGPRSTPTRRHRLRPADVLDHGHGEEERVRGRRHQQHPVPLLDDCHPGVMSSNSRWCGSGLSRSARAPRAVVSLAALKRS
jgi:hypothetical protein